MINPPQHYWAIAKEYIIAQAEYLRKNESAYYLDQNLAYNYIKFASVLRHTAGEYGGVTFQFQDWQIRSIVDIFGTKHATGNKKGTRRYQRALFFMPKKNGKTEYTALLHILYFYLDAEKSKTQYTIGRSLKQAITLRDAVVSMIMQNEELAAMVHATKQPPRVTKQNGPFEDIFEALASDSDNHEGKNVSFFTVDEGHTHTNKDMYQIMANGTVGRREPLEIHLSTAGYNKNGYFYRGIYMYAKKIQEGIIHDETFYKVMFELDKEDMEDPDFWKDRVLWAKVNPNLGISPTMAGLEKEYRSAVESEESLVAFKTKHLNVWCDKADVWINNAVWTANQTKIGLAKLKKLKGRRCYAGLDLSTSVDITALILLFDDEMGGYDIISYFWIPKNKMKKRANRDKVPYLTWHKQGLIQATSGHNGDTIDYECIEEKIHRINKFFNLRMVGYDPWNSNDLVSRLERQDIEMIKLRQGYTLSAANKQIEVLSLQGRLNHGNNEVLNWMMSNVVLEIDKHGNYKLDKEQSTEKIDGIISLSMALTLAMNDDLKEEKISVYEKRGMRIL